MIINDLKLFSSKTLTTIIFFEILRKRPIKKFVLSSVMTLSYYRGKLLNSFKCWRFFLGVPIKLQTMLFLSSNLSSQMPAFVWWILPSFSTKSMSGSPILCITIKENMIIRNSIGMKNEFERYRIIFEKRLSTVH